MALRNDGRPLSICSIPFPSPCSKIGVAVPRPVGEPRWPRAGLHGSKSVHGGLGLRVYLYSCTRVET